APVLHARRPDAGDLQVFRGDASDDARRLRDLPARGLDQSLKPRALRIGVSRGPGGRGSCRAGGGSAGASPSPTPPRAFAECPRQVAGAVGVFLECGVHRRFGFPPTIKSGDARRTPKRPTTPLACSTKRNHTRLEPERLRQLVAIINE